MEAHGIKADRDHLSRLSSDFSQSMARYEAEAYELAGREFNLGSPKQLGEILFDEMAIEGGKTTKTGAWQTGADILEDLAAEGHELPRAVINWRTVSKLRSTYTETLQQQISPRTGRVHTNYGMTGAQTGRLSSNDPNLQNISIRTEEGRKIREAFIPEPGNVLISADYSQIELRLLAHIAGIDALKDAFHQGLDIHAMTASEMFDVPIEGMDPMIRRRAKAINFGIIYGISGFGLARQLSIPRDEASAYIKTYFKRFPGIKAYMDETKKHAAEHEKVETIFGRTLHLKGIKAKGPQRGFAERQAINAPIQGSAADIIKRAMIQMPDALEKAGLQARMLLQVHDELIFEAPEAEAEQIALAHASIAKSIGRAPRGWYSRYSASAATRELVLEHGGYDYDSDAYNDDLPYWTNVDGVEHLVVPYTMVTNDAKFLSGDVFSARDFAECLIDSFETLHAEAAEVPRMMSIGLHPRIIGHPGRIQGLVQFLDHIAGKPGVWICGRAAIADHWRAHVPPPSIAAPTAPAGVAE